jgi:hypothetical protein
LLEHPVHIINQGLRLVENTDDLCIRSLLSGELKQFQCVLFVLVRGKLLLDGSGAQICSDQTYGAREIHHDFVENVHQPPDFCFRLSELFRPIDKPEHLKEEDPDESECYRQEDQPFVENTQFQEQSDKLGRSILAQEV